MLSNIMSLSVFEQRLFQHLKDGLDDRDLNERTNNITVADILASSERR